MDILSLIRTPRKTGSAPPATGPHFTSPAERQALRREMLYEAIRAAFTSHGVYPEHYRFSVVPTDRRGYVYMVTVTLCAGHASQSLAPDGLLARLAADIIRSAQATFGLQVTSVFWSVAYDMPDFLSRKAQGRRVRVADSCSPADAYRVGIQ